MTHRQRVETALAHREPDRVPLDLGSSTVTGMHVSSVYLPAPGLGAGRAGHAGEGDRAVPDARRDRARPAGRPRRRRGRALGGPRTFFGFPNEGWKPWRLFDGTPVLVPAALQHRSRAGRRHPACIPRETAAFRPAAACRADGFYFDTIIRQDPIDEEHLNPRTTWRSSGPSRDADLAHFVLRRRERLYDGRRDRAILANFGGTGFGDIALVPAPWLKHPKGIRDVAEWYMSTVSPPRLRLRSVFERQCEIGLANLARMHEVVGDRVTAVFVTGTDFGTQQGPFISPAAYRDLFQPFHRARQRLGPRAHHLEDLHPLLRVGRELCCRTSSRPASTSSTRCSARPLTWTRGDLKERFGDRLTFWGGGVDTQRTLPFGTPHEVRAEVRERIRVFGPGGGFVFNTDTQCPGRCAGGEPAGSLSGRARRRSLRLSSAP